MAFGNIINEYGNGKYRVTLEVDNALSENLKNRLTAKKQAREDELATYETELDDLIAEELALVGEVAIDILLIEEGIAQLEASLSTLNEQLRILNNELSALKQDDESTEQEIEDKQAEVDAKKEEIAGVNKQIEDKKKDIDNLNKKVKNKRKEILDKQDEINFTELEVASLEKEIDRVNLYGYPTITSPQDVWCVDLTEGLTGPVALLEVATDPEESLNIFPGYSGQVAPTLSAHGNIEPFYSLGVADSLRNFLIYPAVQKWKPSFRYGILGPINYEANTATVYLSYVSSRIQSLAINQANTLYNVPIEYMQCKAGAFEEGDAVVVQFTDYNWSTPKVIGFQREPQPCGWEEPWDGPLYTTRYPWVYRYGFISGTGSTATISTSGGELSVEFPPTDEGSGCIEQYHFIQYVPTNFIITENVSKIKLNADADMNCFDILRGSFHNFGLSVVGFDAEKTTFISYTITFLYNKYYTGVGCLDYPGYGEFETEWGDVVEYEASAPFWYPEALPWRTYERQIYSNKEEYMELPETMITVAAVGLECNVAWVGGATSNTPSQINGGSFTCDIIALA
jgi:hypothetical protein